MRTNLPYRQISLKTIIQYLKGKMMKTTISIAAGCAMILSLSSIAYSAEGPYISGNLGIAIANDSEVTDSTMPGITLDIESDTGYALGGAIGYANFAGNARIEAEVAYQQNDLNKVDLAGLGSLDLTGDASSLSLLVNGYYDFNNSSAFTPYISGGIGVANVEFNDMNTPGSGAPNESDDDTVFAYQVGVGMAYAINETLSLDVKYRYFATSDLEFRTTDVEYSSNNFYAGIRVAF